MTTEPKEDFDRHLIHEPPCECGETEVTRSVAVYRFGEVYCPVCGQVLRRPMLTDAR